MEKNLLIRTNVKKTKNITLLKSVTLQKLIAFSLVELMVSLVTVSCVAAAFAPVITKD